MGRTDDRVPPVFSSDQQAGTLILTHDWIGRTDGFMLLAGGGILAKWRMAPPPLAGDIGGGHGSGASAPPACACLTCGQHSPAAA